MSALQLRPMRELMDIYERYGLRGSFNAEVMQQLAHREWGRRETELASVADAWDDAVVECVSRGHAVQLHLHPQWSGAVWDGGWRLGDRWAITDYPEDRIWDMLRSGKQYLEELIRPHLPDYRVVSFRAGSWAAAPSTVLLPALAELGVVFDMSIVAGVSYDTPMVRLDYRDVDEDFLPYYPEMYDARRMAGEPKKIVCVPTCTFPAPPNLRNALLFHMRQRGITSWPGLRRWLRAPNEAEHPDGNVGADYTRRWDEHDEGAAGDTGIPAPAVPRQIADLSTLGPVEMRTMLRYVRERAAASGWAEVPVILENHTKDAGDMRPLEWFARAVAMADNLEVITSHELAARIQAGRYPIRTQDRA